MSLSSLFLSIPRSTIAALTRYRVLPPHVLKWHDILTTYESLFPMNVKSDRYAATADKTRGMCDERVAKLIRRFRQIL